MYKTSITCSFGTKRFHRIWNAKNSKIYLATLYIICYQLFVFPILFVVPAKFVTKPKSSVTAYKNWDIILKCDIFGYPIPEVKWTRSLKQLPVDRHVIDGNKLTIKDTTKDDGGAYVCQGANELGSVMAVIWIFVKDVGKPGNKKLIF